jgi:hypothetical protein
MARGPCWTALPSWPLSSVLSFFCGQAASGGRVMAKETVPHDHSINQQAREQAHTPLRAQAFLANFGPIHRHFTFTQHLPRVSP